MLVRNHLVLLSPPDNLLPSLCPYYTEDAYTSEDYVHSYFLDSVAYIVLGIPHRASLLSLDSLNYSSYWLADSPEKAYEYPEKLKKASAVSELTDGNLAKYNESVLVVARGASLYLS